MASSPEPDDDAGTSWAPFGSYADDDAPLAPLPPLPGEGPPPASPAASTPPPVDVTPATRDWSPPAPVADPRPQPDWRDALPAPEPIEDQRPDPVPPIVARQPARETQPPPAVPPSQPASRPQEQAPGPAADDGPGKAFWRWPAPDAASRTPGQPAAEAVRPPDAVTPAPPRPPDRPVTTSAPDADWAPPQTARSTAPTAPLGAIALGVAAFSFVAFGFFAAIAALILANNAKKSALPAQQRTLANVAIAVAVVRLLLSVFAGVHFSSFFLDR